jgi:oligopeptide/dipeptide ABC transporter ATP-binding protein
VERERERIVLSGDLPSPADTPTGCRFVSRCYVYQHLLSDAQREQCDSSMPPLEARGERDHAVACYYPELTAEYEPTPTEIPTALS